MRDSTADCDRESVPEGCRSVESHERAFTELADYCESLAREMADSDPSESGTHPMAFAVKLIAETVKARRAASTLAKNREDVALLERLEAAREAMARGRS